MNRPLNEIVKDLWLATQAFDEAKEAKRKIEEELTEALPLEMDKSRNHTLGNYKVVQKTPVIRTIDETAWNEIKKFFAPADCPVKYKPEVAITKYKSLSPEQQLLFAKALTEKPGKVHYTIMEVSKDEN